MFYFVGLLVVCFTFHYFLLLPLLFPSFLFFMSLFSCSVPNVLSWIFITLILSFLKFSNMYFYVLITFPLNTALIYISQVLKYSCLSV